MERQTLEHGASDDWSMAHSMVLWRWRGERRPDERGEQLPKRTQATDGFGRAVRDLLKIRGHLKEFWCSGRAPIATAWHGNCPHRFTDNCHVVLGRLKMALDWGVDSWRPDGERWAKAVKRSLLWMSGMIFQVGRKPFLDTATSPNRVCIIFCQF